MHPKQLMIGRGPCVQISLSLGTAMADEVVKRGGQVPSPVSGWALIDTGASHTCIDDAAAQAMGLPVVDIAHMASATQTAVPRYVYPVEITMVAVGLQIFASRALGAELAAQNLLALIGRDVLSECTLFYNGLVGQITLSAG